MNAKTWYETINNFGFRALNMVYKREGQGPNLLCIHGFPTSSFDFEPIWQKLIAQFNTIAPDLIGLGKSSKPKLKLTVRLQADFIESLLDNLNVEKIHILAHDLGDTIAQELLARQLENRNTFEIQSCTFMNGGIFPETHRPRFIQRLLISPLGPLIARLSFKRTYMKNMNSIFGKKYPPEQGFLDDSWDLLTENGGKLMLPKLIRYMKEREENRDRWVGAIKRSKVPVSLIDGFEDPISGSHMVARFKELFPEFPVFEIPEAGHYPHVECPDIVFKNFTSFLKLEY